MLDVFSGMNDAFYAYMLANAAAPVIGGLIFLGIIIALIHFKEYRGLVFALLIDFVDILPIEEGALASVVGTVPALIYLVLFGLVEAVTIYKQTGKISLAVFGFVESAIPVIDLIPATTASKLLFGLKKNRKVIKKVVKVRRAAVA